MEIKIYDNAEEIGKEVGSEFVKAVNAKPGIVLGLATGASPIPTYKYICEQYKNGLVSLENVKTFNLDEYVALPKNDKNSYYTFMHVQFFNNTDIKEENVHFLNGNADDVDEECRAYDKSRYRDGTEESTPGKRAKPHRQREPLRRLPWLCR